MQDDNPYRHAGVHGLPRSLLARDGRSVAAISFMHRVAGLNRVVRRAMHSPVPVAKAYLQLDRLVSKADWSVLTYYLNPHQRFYTFWATVKELLRPQARRSFVHAVAIDIQLLKTYEPNWLALSLDETELIEACPDWPRIRESVEQLRRPSYDNLPFGMFMLWPRILKDLENWNRLSVDAREKVGHAVFALASGGRTDWFIRQAIEHCPALGEELAELLTNESLEEGAPTEPDTSPVGDTERMIGSIGESQSIDVGGTTNHDAQWQDLLDRLDTITSELKQHPTQEAIADLAELAERCSALAPSFPKRLPVLGALFEAKRNALMTLLVDLATRRAFDWLDEDLISQLEARWNLASHAKPDQLEELTEDAADAVSRVERGAIAYEDATERVLTSVDEVESAERAVADAKSFRDRSSANALREKARRSQLEAESTQESARRDFIAAASPNSEPFDEELDYLEELRRVATSVVDTDLPLPRIEETNASREEPLPPVEEAALATMATPANERQVAVSAGEPIDTDIVISQENGIGASPDRHSEAHESVPQESATTGVEATEYNESAGEQCRPIWRFLSAGQPALAFHAARWTEEISPETRVPPVDLLAAVALADELMLPDGSLQSELGAHLERLVPADFGAESPKSWHSAINLLLVAATIRPLILAPNSGVGATASYLHQDGHYPGLYSLMQKLRGLSAKLVGFHINPQVLREARGEAAIRAELVSLQAAARDWLLDQAPHYTNKFAHATNVWKHWVRNGVIDRLVSPVIENDPAELAQVRGLLTQMSDSDYVIRLVHETDRKVLGRRRGEDIHSGALEHLMRNADEALRYPRQWIALNGLLGVRGDRLRGLLEEVREALLESQASVERELSQQPEHDPWDLIAGGQKQALSAIRGLRALFDGTSVLQDVEPPAAEVLGRPLLCIPELPIDEAWQSDVDAEVALGQLALIEPKEDWAANAIAKRMERGDLLGAEMMVSAGLVASGSVMLRQERERWKQALRREISECRRSVEIGSAYGFLPDAERSEIESLLARWEAQVEDLRRFDVVLGQIKKIRDRVALARESRKQEVRARLSEIPISDSTQSGVAEVEKALNDGDIATADELVHWLSQGRPSPTVLDEDEREGFDTFFPESMKAIDAWLGSTQREKVEQALSRGQSIPGFPDRRVEAGQRAQAERAFIAWSDIKSHQRGEESRLKTLLTAIGLQVKELRGPEKASERETWNLDVAAIEDRQVCPLPMYGSTARGRYRLVCVWGKPTEEEILQWVGDVSLNPPAFVLYFGRMSERSRRELSRLTKTRRRAAVLLDETLMAYLCCIAGSRLPVLFDVALPFSYSLPYDATAGLVPPEMFYGRGQELEAVRGLNGRCFIYGGRQLGKTALLKRAEQSFHAPTHGRFARWIDLRAEGIGVSLAAGEIWLTLHEKLKEMQVLDPKSPAPTPGKKQGAEALVRTIRDFLSGNPDRRILLLLDEADRFFEQDGRNDFEETRKLKQLMDVTQRRFKVVFAGLHNVLRMTERPNHPLAHFGEPIEIGPLGNGDEVKEAADLIRKPMAAAGIAFDSKGLVIRILAQTNYYPSLIQLYCSHLLRHLMTQVVGRQKQDGPRYLVTDRDIEQVYSSEALRDEIRAKFRLTLQLDPRYEVLAYAMALDLLRGRYSQSEGMPWQSIRQAGALHWWSEGFRDTSELDFRVLLDEMVGLGVLRPLPSGHYALRNPNVLLLLGTQEEIETVLYKEREPAVEFESATFRPPLRKAPAQSTRNAFTYQQLSRLLQRVNGITVVAGTHAAGVDAVAASLQDFLGPDAEPVILRNCADRQSFGSALQSALVDRPKDQVSVFVVPAEVPWTELWLQEAQSRLKRLSSESKFASLVFVADPGTLWRLLEEERESSEFELPWMSLLPWNDSYLRNWLEERQLQMDADDRRRLSNATGGWPYVVTEFVGDSSELRVVRERLNSVDDQRSSARTEPESSWIGRFGLDVQGPIPVLKTLAEYRDPLEAHDLAELTGLADEHVQKSLRWGELLGLVRREGAGFWTVDPMVAKVISSARV